MQKLKKVKISLKQLNNSEFKGVKIKMTDLREQLQHIQESMRDPLAVDLNRQQEKELQIQ